MGTGLRKPAKPGKLEMIGKPISHYKILEKLGGGGMGVFYLEEDNKFERRMLSNFASDLGHSKEQKRFEINNLKM